MNDELTDSIQKELAIALPDRISLDELEKLLATHINKLIQDDFERLIALLYRIDINELKLRALLQEHVDENAGLIIAQLIIERQIQKIESRKKFKQDNSDIPGEEKW